jgi:spore coat protein H
MLSLLLGAAILAGSLPEYHLSIDEEYLEEMLADPFSGRSYPAHIACPGGSSDCMVKIRGNTATECPKKSLAIDLDDPGVLGRTRLNLNAQYRDLSQMRDGLGMLATRLLGYPAPLTRHVELYVNGDYWGVYLEIERVDEDFLERNGLGSGPLFKATDHTARFAWLPSGVPQTFGFRPMSGGAGDLAELLRLIDAALGEGVPEIDAGMFLAYYAVVLAIVDNDGGSMNFYLHRGADGVWRIFPWDRDSSFGSEWGGAYNPELYRCTDLPHLQRTSLYGRLLRDPDAMRLFEEDLSTLAALMTGELTAAVDSIYLEIRDDVYRDTMKQGSDEDFDRAYGDLRTFLQQRSAFLGEQTTGLYEPTAVCSIRIEPVRLAAGDDSVTVTAWTEAPVAECRSYVTVDLGETFELSLGEAPGSGGMVWTGSVAIPTETYSVRFALRTLSVRAGQGEFPVWFHFFPGYGYMMFEHDYWLCTHPTSVRELAPFLPESLAAGAPVRYGPSLWLLPLVNAGVEPLDLSFCSFEVGEPPGRVFLPGTTVLPPGDTLYLASDLPAAEHQWPGRRLAGSCSASDIGGGALTLFDPCWNPVAAIPVPVADSTTLPGAPLVLSEISPSGGGAFGAGDWLEVHNPGPEPLLLGGYRFEDPWGDGSPVPFEGSEIPPGGLLVLCRDADRFRRIHPDVTNVVEGLDFGLSDEGDEIRILDRSGRTVETLAYGPSPPWPPPGDGVLSLFDPWGDWRLPGSWEAVDPPGTPGTRNPGWFSSGSWLRITGLAPNPARGALRFTYAAADAPICAWILDLCGRVVRDIGPLPPWGGGCETSWMDGELPPGIYFLLLRSGGRIASRKFTVL